VEHASWLNDLAVFLVAAGLVVPLFHHLRIGAVLGFLLVGLAVGPYGFGLFAAEYPWVRYLTIEDRASVDVLAELGVMFLLFLIGLEMSVERLWSLRRYVLGVGSLQFALSAAAIASVVAILGIGGDAAIVLGLCLAMSSTAIVMQLLQDQGRSATPAGRVAVSVLLFQDLMVAPVLLGTEVLGRGGDRMAFAFGLALLQAIAAVVAIGIAGRFVLRPLFRFAARTGSRELIMAMTLLIVLGSAVVTGQAGLSAGLGAFLAGVLLSETEYRHQVEIDLAPFKGLLLGLFFITVGMTIDARAVWSSIGTVLAMVALLFVIKAAVLFIAGRLFGVGMSVAIEVALLLAQAGEFAFIVIALANGLGVLPADTAQLATAVVGISMLLTPFCALGGRWLGRRMQRIDHGHHMPTAQARELSDHVVIGGYGRVGQMIGRLLAAESVPFVALDDNGELVAEMRDRGSEVFFGDASLRELLERVGADRARAFVVTVSALRAAERMVAAVRRKRPDALVFARAHDAGHAARLLKLGAVGVIPEAVEASLQLGGRVLEGLGLSDDAVARRLAELRDQERGKLASERRAVG
jgi:monovalent cation:H+ antiporter-2, CPA2 family